MNNSRKPLSISEAKIQASLLLKSWRKGEVEKAAKRFKRLPEFSELSFAEVMQSHIKYKHALAVIAVENGFQSWAELKMQLPLIKNGFLNEWFAHYAEAKAYLHEEGGYLFPFKNHFFVCDAHYIAYLGFDPLDTDWQLIGFDWTNPSDKVAWKRLCQKWVNIQENNNG